MGTTYIILALDLPEHESIEKYWITYISTERDLDTIFFSFTNEDTWGNRDVVLQEDIENNMNRAC